MPRVALADSVMAIFPLDKRHPSGGAKTERELIQEAFATGEKAAAEATRVFGDCNELECEKTALPYLLWKKKTYAARTFEDPHGEAKLDVKGLALVRRDCTDWVASTMRCALNALIMRRSVEEARAIVNTQLHRLVNDEVTLQELTLSRRISGSYKSENLPQVKVVKKMEARNPGSGPKSGDRVAFCIIETEDPNHKVFQKAEDVAFVADPANGVKIDRLHYLTNEITNPLVQLFSPFVENPQQEILEGARLELERQRMGHATLVEFEWEKYAPARAMGATAGDLCIPSAKKKRKQTLLF